MRSVYLDYAATTPVDPRVTRVMQPYFSEQFANPGAAYRIGQEAFRAISHSREIVAGAFGCESEGVIFTASATEANNLALRGVVRGRAASFSADDVGSGRILRPATRRPGETARSVLGSLVPPAAGHRARSPVRHELTAERAAHARPEHAPAPALVLPHVITTVVEHDSVFEVCRALEEEGLVEVTYVGVDRDGIVSPADIAKALRPETILVSVIYANNEIGTIQPITEIAKIIRDFRITQLLNYPLFHIDAVQAVQFLDCNMERLGVDLLTVSSHKIYGPKGAAALCQRPTPYTLYPIIFGGGQERGLRSGTENVPAIVGFGKAVELALARRVTESKRLVALRDYFIGKLLAHSRGVALNGSAEHRLPNNVNVSLPGRSSDVMVTMLDRAGIAASAGSACSARAVKSSRVLQALGVPQELARSALRFSLGRHTAKRDLDYVVKTVVQFLR